MRGPAGGALLPLIEPHAARKNRGRPACLASSRARYRLARRLARPTGLGAAARAGRAHQGQHPRQGRASLPCGEEPLWAPQDPLPRTGEEHRATAHPVCPGQSAAGAQAGFAPRHPRCVRSVRNETKGGVHRRFSVPFCACRPKTARSLRSLRPWTSTASAKRSFLQRFPSAPAQPRACRSEAEARPSAGAPCYTYRP